MSFFDSFDADSIQASSAPDVIPEGRYRAVIASVAERQTRNNGLQISVGFEINDGGKYNGQRVFENYNVLCPSSAKAEEIARGQLASMCKAANVKPIGNGSNMRGRSLYISVSVANDDYNGGMKNKIKGYSSVDQPVTPQATGPSAPSAPSEPSDKQKFDAPDWA